MRDENQCSALSDDWQKCGHGFLTNAGCHPAQINGRWSETLPQCCNEDWSARFFEKSDGRPPQQSFTGASTI